MKIIKNNKLFGILNLFDCAIILVLIIVILPALHYYIKFNERGVAEQLAFEKYLKTQEMASIVTLDGSQGILEIYVSFKNLTNDDIKKINPKIVIIILTIHYFPQYKEKCINAGADYFFSKSDEFKKIIDVIEELISKKV